VRREAYEKVLEAARVMQSKYSTLMQETTDAAVAEVKASKALEDSARLKADNKSLREEAAHCRAKVDAFEQTLHAAAGADTAAEQRAALVQLRVELASSLRQTEFDTKERRRLEEGKGELESKLKEVEAKLAHMSTALHAATEAEASQLRRLTTAVSMSQYRCVSLSLSLPLCVSNRLSLCPPLCVSHRPTLCLAPPPSPGRSSQQNRPSKRSFWAPNLVKASQCPSTGMRRYLDRARLPLHNTPRVPSNRLKKLPHLGQSFPAPLKESS
jgi:hypothetical protein